jgi:hypothetical protein
MTQCTGSCPEAKELYLLNKRENEGRKGAEKQAASGYRNSYALSTLELEARYMDTRYFLYR